MTSLSMSGDGAFLQDYSKGKFGLSLGLVGEFMLNDQFALAPEVNYASAGDYYKGGGGEYTIFLSYIQIPVMAKYYINENFSINAGPQIGVLMSADGESKVGDNTDSDDLKDDFNSTDIGMNIGAGYKMENGLFFDVRYYLGLTNIAKDSGNTDVKNKGFQFGIGYFFN